MAEVEYQVKMAKLQNTAQKMNQTDFLIARFKIEDTIYDSHRVETEHFLLLKENYADLQSKSLDETESTLNSSDQLSQELDKIGKDVED